MATRTFKRDEKGRFAATDTRSGSKKKRLSKAEREAAEQGEVVSELKQQRAVEKAQQQLKDAEAEAASAESLWRKAKKAQTGDAALDAAWARRIKAAEKLARAMKRRANVGQ